MVCGKSYLDAVPVGDEGNSEPRCVVCEHCDEKIADSVRELQEDDAPVSERYAVVQRCKRETVESIARYLPANYRVIDQDRETVTTAGDRPQRRPSHLHRRCTVASPTGVTVREMAASRFPGGRPALEVAAMTSTTTYDKTDKELISMHVAGDKEAFAELYARHRGHLRAVAAGIAGNDADDAVQEAMISAYSHADQYHGESKVTTWLHRIVVNAALDIARHKPYVAESVSEPSYPPWRIEQAGNRMDLRRHWKCLSPQQRASLVLVDMLGYPIAEAAKILGVSKDTLKTRCARGRHKLAGRLQAYGLS